MLSPDAVERLKEDFRRADYLVDPAMDAIGEAGRADLARNHTAAAERALAGRHDPLATLIRLFVLQLPQPRARVAAAVPLDDLLAAGILKGGSDTVSAAVDLRPYGGDDGTSGWLASDHQATVNTARSRPRPDHVLGLSPASVTLAQLTPRSPVGAALDLGTGCGVQSLHLARHAARVVATDLNPRALELAALTLALSDVAADLRLGSLYEPVAGDLRRAVSGGDPAGGAKGDRFDLITTNPPFVIAPPARPRLTYRESTFESDGLMRAVVSGAGDHLAPGGGLVVLGNWAHIVGEPWQDRVASWLPPGADALIVQRETLDPAEYAEVWLADAGLAGTAAYRARLDAWLAHFDRLRIEAVGLGWIVAQLNGRADPSVTALDWPHPVAQPVAADLQARLAAVDASRLQDPAFLATRWRLAEDAYQESVGRPGAADPTHVTFRRTTGLLPSVPVDTALAGVLGACDGDLPLGVILSAVADLLDEDHARLTARLLPTLRRLAAEAWVTPPPP
ncbi:MAG: methyltransferase [Propionibacteriaceae bacterium]|jgi:methylase of polypeptide subunit release factors|nr:methyltransferase [Propionibacteriaceae bacterium]